MTDKPYIETMRDGLKRAKLVAEIPTEGAICGCMRVDEAEHVYEGSVQAVCVSCSAPIWRSTTTPANATLLCLQCMHVEVSEEQVKQVVAGKIVPAK